MVLVRVLLLFWVQVRVLVLGGGERFEGVVVLDAEWVVFVDVDPGGEGLVSGDRIGKGSDRSDCRTMGSVWKAPVTLRGMSRVRGERLVEADQLIDGASGHDLAVVIVASSGESTGGDAARTSSRSPPMTADIDVAVRAAASVMASSGTDEAGRVLGGESTPARGQR